MQRKLDFINFPRLTFELMHTFLNDVARENEQLSLKKLIHLSPWDFLLDFWAGPPQTSKKNGPVFGFELILTSFWESYSLQHIKKSLIMLSAVKNSTFRGGKQTICEHPWWNQALFLTNQAWECWLWCISKVREHFCSSRLSSRPTTTADFTMGEQFLSCTFSIPQLIGWWLGAQGVHHPLTLVRSSGHAKFQVKTLSSWRMVVVLVTKSQLSAHSLVQRHEGPFSELCSRSLPVLCIRASRYSFIVQV